MLRIFINKRIDQSLANWGRTEYVRAKENRVIFSFTCWFTQHQLNAGAAAAVCVTTGLDYDFTLFDSWLALTAVPVDNLRRKIYKSIYSHCPFYLFFVVVEWPPVDSSQFMTKQKRKQQQPTQKKKSLLLLYHLACASKISSMGMVANIGTGNCSLFLSVPHFFCWWCKKNHFFFSQQKIINPNFILFHFCEQNFVFRCFAHRQIEMKNKWLDFHSRIESQFFPKKWFYFHRLRAWCQKCLYIIKHHLLVSFASFSDHRDSTNHNTERGRKHTNSDQIKYVIKLLSIFKWWLVRMIKLNGCFFPLVGCLLAFVIVGIVVRALVVSLAKIITFSIYIILCQSIKQSACFPFYLNF